MKIIFDNEAQKELFISMLGSLTYCPSWMGLEDKAGITGCDNCTVCWEEAFEMEVREDENGKSV